MRLKVAVDRSSCHTVHAGRLQGAVLLLLSKCLACLAIPVVRLLEGRARKQIAIRPSTGDDCVAGWCHAEAAPLKGTTGHLTAPAHKVFSGKRQHQGIVPAHSMLHTAAAAMQRQACVKLAKALEVRSGMSVFSKIQLHKAAAKQ